MVAVPHVTDQLPCCLPNHRRMTKCGCFGGKGSHEENQEENQKEPHRLACPWAHLPAREINGQQTQVILVSPGSNQPAMVVPLVTYRERYPPSKVPDGGSLEAVENPPLRGSGSFCQAECLFLTPNSTLPTIWKGLLFCTNRSRGKLISFLWSYGHWDELWHMAYPPPERVWVNLLGVLRRANLQEQGLKC